jgi:hypothetical protein
MSVGQPKRDGAAPARGRHEWVGLRCARLLGVPRLPAAIVDLLPIGGRPGNLHMIRSRSLHFCTADGVRTVEWDSREVGRGRKPFPDGRWDETEQ